MMPPWHQSTSLQIFCVLMSYSRCLYWSIILCFDVLLKVSLLEHKYGKRSCALESLYVLHIISHNFRILQMPQKLVVWHI